MQSIAITFFPHATTLDNEAGISTGAVEVDLSPLGKQQVLTLKAVLHNQSFDAVFSSTLSRAKETAEGALGDRYKIIVDQRLQEINIGDLTKKNDTFTHPLAVQHIETPFPHGESWRDVENRVRSFLNTISSTHAGKRIAIFGHQGTQLALEVITKNISWEEALKNDWRNTKSFQYGWEYSFTIVSE